jgi:hypothetical protein
MVSENRVLSGFGSKQHKATGGWRKFQNEELQDLYSSPNIIRMTTSWNMRLAGHVDRMGGVA